MLKWRWSFFLLLWIPVIVSPLETNAQLILAKNGKSDYKIVIPANASAIEIAASSVLQKYFTKISGVTLAITTDGKPRSTHEIRIGKTNRSVVPYQKLMPDGLFIKSANGTLLLSGNGKGVLYSVYTFLENYLGCRKFTSGELYLPALTEVAIPDNINLIENPAFGFREVYYPESADQEYLDWHKLNRRDETWGLWVHTFDKLVPAKTYFSKHPEYYALVDGKRQPSQLCLSNPEVLKILTENLRNKIADDPQKKYWSVSQNDGLGYCECDRCRAIDEREGGPQGSIVNFVNKVAAQFPGKVISTLAYSYSRHAPKILRPAANVQIMFSSIDCNRSKPIATDPRSAGFRKDLHDWTLITKDLFVWDYVVQFTNYVSPFPNLRVLQPNIEFFKNSGVKGLFEQGSGEYKGEFSELRGYLLAKLSWNPNVDVKQLTSEFLQYYYGKAAPFIDSYINLLHDNLEKSGRVLDIYGTPVREYNAYLNPELIDQYGLLFDQAESAVENNRNLLQHVLAVRLPVEYAVLQQSKFYGIEKFGAFVREGTDGWVVKNGLQQRVRRFVDQCNLAGISYLAEEGMTPNEYLEDWNEVFRLGPKLHLALEANVTMINPFSTEYPNKGARTLVDGSRGYNDFQYNWLGWYGDDMAFTVDLGKSTMVNRVGLSFLEDQRHWAFLPQKISIEVSEDGNTFTTAGELTNNVPYENYDVSIKDNTLNLSAALRCRYIRVTAFNLKQLPTWRAFKDRKAWIFTDEITVR